MGANKVVQKSKARRGGGSASRKEKTGTQPLGAARGAPAVSVVAVVASSVGGPRRYGCMCFDIPVRTHSGRGPGSRNYILASPKEAKMKAAMAGGKSKKKKWSKGKVKEKLANLVMFDQATYDKMLKEIPKAKLITTAIVSERLKVNGSVARQAIRHLEEKDLIQVVGERSSSMLIYTRKIGAGD
ncbi:unnamed protein product [Prorocentrum cordatum]|uniref:40S ribosomal protein S25 n=1 Tax=Prorocentrum cordatum TaxID=2364126 RepID=A0ABN9RJ90_9DINO|nr:unnamed protein product [Polarella glacialis]